MTMYGNGYKDSGRDCMLNLNRNGEPIYDGKHIALLYSDDGIHNYAIFNKRTALIESSEDTLSTAYYKALAMDNVLKELLGDKPSGY